MLFQIIEENGVKKIQALTADAGAGNPVGTIIPMYKKSSPSGYLYCDGSTFDETAYPLLYAYLGTNVLPDYREFALVGAEQNTTSSNIADHDIYTEGQEKDDQLQDHVHSVVKTDNDAEVNMYNHGTGGTSGGIEFNTQFATELSAKTITEGRHGTVTRGKRKAVYFYIKATSGLSENAQDNVINTLNEQRSYSTEEHLTGKKWIDGKPIYEVTVDCGALPVNTQKLFPNVMSNADKVVKITGITSAGSATIPLPYAIPNYYINIYCPNKTDLIVEDNEDFSAYYESYVTIEYTKTTD